MAEGDTGERRKIFPRMTYNWVSVIGAVLALISAFVIIFLLSITLISGTTNPYLGVLLYLILPGFLIAGLLLIPIGMYIRWRDWQKTGRIPYLKWPLVDLNIRRHRNAVMTFVLGTLLFILISSVGLYQAYHYTDSVAFCGTICHTVMKPEYTTYQNSPHARVKCVSCHIGPGAGWYAKSKLRGLYQVYAVAANVYPRPIPTPISDLRPARETCETCHWPRYFIGARQRQFNHYMYDKDNTHWKINMLLKIGGNNPAAPQATGIHWHMNFAIKIEYASRDKKRQDIPWVRVTDILTGRTIVYQDALIPLSKEQLSAAEIRMMDCMDCHNRPSHNFHSPDSEIDLAILAGLSDQAIPEIKKTSVEAMTKAYKSDTEAIDGIYRSITDFYRTGYTGFYLKNRARVDRAIQAAQSAYLRNFFPVMKARWSFYPNNIGHFMHKGCMRCHDGNHKSSDGTPIPNNCRNCHVILSQGSKKHSEKSHSGEGLDFRHPVDIGDAWKGGGCYNCHTGVQP